MSTELSRWLRNSAAAHCAILAGLWALFFWRYFAAPPNQVVFPDGDFTQQFFVFRSLAFRELVAGRLPLWTDCFFGGYPFHADPQAQLFYPPVWLSFGALRLLGYGHFPLLALTAETVAHYLIAGLGAYAFLRAETGRGLAALAGALVFTFGGYLTGYPPLQTGILETAAWLPLLLLALRRLAVNTGAASRAIACGLLALMFFAGHPQSFMLCAYLAIAYFLFCGRAAGSQWRALLWRLAPVVLLGALISAVQLLPQAQYLSLSTRSSLPYAELAHGFPLQDLAQLFVTGLVSRWQPLFMGILGLTLALLAATAVPTAAVRFWVATVLAGALLSFGSSQGAYGLAYWILPGYSLFRGQERAALIVAMGSAALVAHGAALLLGPLPRHSRRAAAKAARLLRALTLPVIVLLIVVVLLARADAIKWGDLPPRFGLLLLGVALAAITLAARPLRAWFPGVLLTVLALELFAANSATNAAAPFETYPYRPMLDALQKDAGTGRWFRVQDDARMNGHWACMYGLREWGGISPIRPRMWMEFDTYAAEDVRFKLLGVDYLVSWKMDPGTREGLPLAAQTLYHGPAPEGDAKVYRLPFTAQRAWVAGKLQRTASPEEQWQLLRTPGFDALGTALVEAAAAPALVPSTGSAQVNSDQSGALQLTVQSAAPGLLVVSEAWYPGWMASVNGAAWQPSIPVNGFVQGVALPSAGTHTVQLQYRPPALLWGAGLSLLGIALAVLPLLWRKPGRRAADPA